MSIYRTIKERGRAASDYYAGRPDYFYLTPASLALLRAIEAALPRYCRGRVLDAGAGRGVYRDLLQKHANDYVGMDLAASVATTVLGDARRLPFAAASFDTVFCSQVLEHVPEPALALAEFRRVLRPGGYLILTVPHISWLHNEPHDYFRFTVHGLRFLSERAGFAEAEVVPAGGLFSLAGHILSTLAVNGSFGVPVLHPLIRKLNRLWVETMAGLDRLLNNQKVFPLNYLWVAENREAPGAAPAGE